MEMAAGVRCLPTVSQADCGRGGTEAHLCRVAVVIQSREVAERCRGSPDCLSPVAISRLGLTLLFLSAFFLFSMFWRLIVSSLENCAFGECRFVKNRKPKE